MWICCANHVEKVLMGVDKYDRIGYAQVIHIVINRLYSSYQQRRKGESGPLALCSLGHSSWSG